ncbi:hypothetical protein ABK040_011022 [Willaertia magna]
MKGSLNENTSTTPRHQQQQSTNEVEDIDENESNNSNTNNNNRFVPFYLRDDLPANRQSKQRNNQKRRRKTIQDVIQQLANNGISLTNTNNNPSINNNNTIKHPYNSSSTTTSRTFHNNNANINNNNSIIHHLHSFSSSSSCNSSSTGFPITTPPLNSSSIIHTTNNTIPLHHHSSNTSNNNTNNNNTILPSVVITQTSGVQERFSLAPSPSSFNINLTTPNVNNNNTTISNNNTNNTNHSNTGLTTKVRSASVFTASNNVKPTSSSSNTKFQQHQDPQNDLRALNSSAQVLNYLKNIQQQQQAFMQQNKLLQPPPDINVSVNHIKNQLLTNNTTIVSSNTYIPSYTLNPTVDMMIYNWEAKIRKEQQRQRLQKLRRPIPSLRLPPIRDDNLSSSMLDSPSSGGSQSDRTLTLRSLSSRTNGMSSRSTSPLNSPTSSTLSSSSDLMIDDEEFTLKSRLDSALVDKLPSISKLNLPPFSLPHSSSSTCPFSLSPQNNVINTENNGGNNSTSTSGEQGGIQHFLQQQPYTSGPFINPISLNHNNNNNTTSATSTTNTTHQYTYRPEGLLTSRYHHYYHPNNNNGQQQQHFVFNGTVGNNNMYNNNKVEESTQSSIITSLISPRLTRNGGNKVHHNRTSPRSSPRNTYHPYPSPYHIDGTSGVISPRKKKKVSPPSSSSSTNNTTVIDNNNNSSTIMQEQGSSSLHNASNDPTVAISTNNINTTSQQQPVGGIVGSISPEEQQHRMSMELFEAIFRHTPVPMYILNAKGYFTAVNQSFVSMLGFGLESEFVNKSAFGLVIAEDNREELMGQIKVFAASETNNNMMAHQHRKYQVRMKDRRGTNILSENTVYVLKDVIGSGEFYVFTVTNYAENKILL